MIRSCPVPSSALLRGYATRNSYTDCYFVDVEGSVPLPDFVFAFYTSPVFKLERWILKWLVAKPSTDAGARRLAEGVSNHFSAWLLESRARDQILMCDFLGRTRSWLLVRPAISGDVEKTRLYFGSAIVSRYNAKTGKSAIGPGFTAMLWVHKLYSRLLLLSAKWRLNR